jgi:ATP adenylyltransferase
MERLWAPWRMGYIMAESGEEKKLGCIFCDLPAEGNARYRENLILCAGDHAFVILNRYPYNNAHLMVVPRLHVPDPSELPSLDFQILSELLRRTTAELKLVYKPHGINLGMNLGRTGGAGIDEHCHYHIVPRWNGDTNFMPVVGDVKVISEGIEETYDRLLPSFESLAARVEEETG